MKFLIATILVLIVTSLVLSSEQQFTLDDVQLFNDVKLQPFKLDNITWFECPFFSVTPTPVYENITKKAEEEHYHQQVLKSVREHVSGKTRRLSTPIPDIRMNDAIRGLAIPMAECAIVKLPLDYTNPETSQLISVFVKRFRQSRESVAPNSLWLLQGGPGGSYTAFEKIARVLLTQLPTHDIYTTEHRGVGYSTRLGCLATQAETTGSEEGITISDDELYGCSRELLNEYRGNMDKFSPTGAAWDLASLVQTTNELYGYNTFIYGVSYGTMWLSRFLLVSKYNDWNTDKKLYKAVIMDGVVSSSSGNEANPDTPERLQFNNWDINMNAVGEYMFETYCGNDTICYKKLVEKNKKGLVIKTPLQVVQDVFEAVYSNGTCPKFSSAVSAESLRSILGGFLVDMNTRELIPAVFYRLKRCDPDVDIPALLHLAGVMTAQQNVTCIPLTSQMLYYNVAFSELWAVDLSKATYEKLYAEFNATIMSTGAYSMAKSLEVSQYPLYKRDQYFNQAPKPDVPTLLLNGDLDPQTTWSSAHNQYVHMDSELARFITIKYAPHASVFRSPHKNSSIPCGMDIMVSFLKTQDVNNIDTSCLDNLVPVNFAGNSQVNQLVFGVSDIYEDAYETPEVEKKVNLYLFIGVEAGTVVVSIIAICCLIYYIVQLKDKSSEYEEIDD